MSLALRLTSQYSLSHWDSLLVAAAIEAGVDALYTEDLQPGAKYESLTVVSPFD
jgi:predicted nucleic acid-binding protein